MFQQKIKGGGCLPLFLAPAVGSKSAGTYPNPAELFSHLLKLTLPKQATISFE